MGAEVADYRDLTPQEEIAEIRATSEDILRVAGLVERRHLMQKRLVRLESDEEPTTQHATRIQRLARLVFLAERSITESGLLPRQRTIFTRKP